MGRADGWCGRRECLTCGPVIAARHAPAADVSALLAAATQAVAEHTADADRARAELATYVELVERYTHAADELWWALEASDSDAGNRAAAELWNVLDDAKAALR